MADRMFASEDDSAIAGRLEPNGRRDPAARQSSDALDDVQGGVARRLQGRLDRHLWLLDRMQSDPLISEPPGLAELLEIGRRMRRDTESLLLLSGQEPGVRSGRSRRLADVLGDAAAAAEESRRVDVRTPAGGGISPAAATELLHVVAELIDHVTAVYPGARVDVSTRAEAPSGIAVEIRAEGAGRYDPEGLGGRRALEAAQRLAGRSRSGLGLQLPDVTTGLVASIHVPGAVVVPDEPERSLPWAGGASAQESARALAGSNGAGTNGALHSNGSNGTPAADSPASSQAGSSPATATANGSSANGFPFNGQNNVGGFGSGGPQPGANGGRSPALPSRPAAYQPSTPPPLQHSQPVPLQHSQPTPLQHSQPTPLQHSRPVPLQHSRPVPLQHSQPVPLQHSQPLPLPSLPQSVPPPLPALRPRPSTPSPRTESSVSASPLGDALLAENRGTENRRVGSRRSAVDARGAGPAWAGSSRGEQSPVDELFGPLLDLAHDPSEEVVATPIFEAIASAWFREDAALPPARSGGGRASDPLGSDPLGSDPLGSGAMGPLDWETPSDVEWREAAARAARPEPTPQTAGGGLPRRRPGTQLVPPPRARSSQPEAGPAERVPDRIRDRLSTYQRGLREGRHRAEPPKEQPRPERDAFDPEAW